jgi:hypothetical protein
MSEIEELISLNSLAAACILALLTRAAPASALVQGLHQHLQSVWRRYIDEHLAAGECNRALEMVRHLELAQGGVSAVELIEAGLLNGGSALLSPSSPSASLCLNDVKSSPSIDAKALDSSSSDCERHPSAVTLASASIARSQHFAAVFHDVCNKLVQAER